jgi:hypothetical protein
MEIYADVACSLFAYPERFYTRLQRNNIRLDVVRLAILLVDGLERRSDVSIMRQWVGQGFCICSYCNWAVFNLVTIFRTSECVI